MNLFHAYKITNEFSSNSQKATYYRAIRQLDRVAVIIKTINPQISKTESRAWLKNEQTILQKLNCPGIINSSGWEEDRDSIALILDNFQGDFLELFLERHKISIEKFLIIAIKLVVILQQIHASKIIHENLHPASIIINPKNLDLKITNFILASQFNNKTHLSSTKLEALNIAYISPEQTGRINLALDYRTDFYSLGVIFYKILTGKLPFDTQDSLQLIHCHFAKIPVPPYQIDARIPQAISSIVMKLLAKNPDDRYQSAYGIKTDLETCQTQYQNQGKIELFELGTLDKYSYFRISPQLYGRSSAIDTIESSLARVYSGTTEVLLVSGQLGIGKTSLIKKATQQIITEKGFLIEGKFELSQINIPYVGVRQAFKSLIQQLLTENTDCLQGWREKILSAVGNNGRVITNILPELELIIGSQANVPQLPAKETENRFNIVFIEFVRVFTHKEHPLVLFFDNLQWADSASLNLLGLLLEKLDSQYLLMIWAYQNAEIERSLCDRNRVFSDFANFTYLLDHTTRNIEQKLLVTKIELQPLSLNDVNQLLVDTLHCEKSQSLPLAELLLKRTLGNPLFINQLLQTFYEEELLTFDFPSFSWQWQLAEIRSTSINDYSLLKLVVKNLEKLSDKTQQVLKVAACIGNQFDLETLETVCNYDKEQTIQALQLASEAGIIFLAGEQPKLVYRFSHNNVRETAYSLLEETEKSQIHFEIGQFLLQHCNSITIETKIFNLVNHLNLGRKLFSENLLKNRVAELNLIAGKKAKSAIAYEVADNYLNIALELLPRSAWRDNYDLIFNVYVEAIEVQYLRTNFKLTEHLANIAFGLAKTISERVKIYSIKIHAYIARNQMDLAIDTGLSILELLNVSLPNKPTQNNDLNTLLDKDKGIEYLKSLATLPKMTDPPIMAAMEILSIIIPPVYIVKPQLFPLIVFTMVDLCLEYGNCRFSAFAYGVYGLLSCASGNIDTGYQLGKLALAIQEQFEAKELQSKISFIFNNTIRHWKEPAINTIDYFLEGIEKGIEVGDIEHACFHAKYYCTYLFFIGEPLSSADEKSRNQINSIQNFKQDFQLNYARIWRQLNLNLQGLAEDRLLLIGESFDESVLLPVWQATNNATSLFAFYLAKLILCYFLQDYRQAIVNAHQGKKYLDAAVGTMCFSEYYFYASLAKLALCSSQADIEAESLSEIISNQKQLKQWANHAPDNYLNKYHLVTAEIARVLGKKERAAENYDRAIKVAIQVGYIHEAALAEELTAKFYLSQGRAKIAEYYLTDAYQKYLDWGAMAKLQALKLKYSQLLTRISYPEQTIERRDKVKVELSSQLENLATLDLFSVLKASQAISSEIILDNLLAKMMEIVMENAGARKTTLFLKEKSSWVIAASATMMPEIEINVSQIPIAEYLKLPNSIINYIQSTRNSVILEQASQEGLFTDDPYIVKYQPQSVLACPIIYQNELQGIIYLENNLVKGAFTSKKLEILQILLSQVSISIENARLYKNLENHASVQKSLKQKEILLKEIHHRVKNNLFVVSSLLDFQSSYIEDPEVIRLLENCQNRITSMALVHQHLYGNHELNKINFADYIESLLDNLAYSQASAERNINFVRDLDEIELNIETANPCGLIINELVSNALEHGFENRDCGNIWLSLKHNLEGQITLTIQDDGIGFKEDFDLYNSDSLGLELVCTLVEQLDGEIELDKTQGTKIIITFKELDYRSRI